MNSPDMVANVYSGSNYLVPYYQAKDTDIQREPAEYKAKRMF